MVVCITYSETELFRLTALLNFTISCAYFKLILQMYLTNDLTFATSQLQTYFGEIFSAILKDKTCFHFFTVASFIC